MANGRYRLYNRDIQYPVDNPQGLYGAIPFLMAHHRGTSSGVLWMNAADTTVSLSRGTASPKARLAKWLAVGGIAEAFVCPGLSPSNKLLG